MSPVCARKRKQGNLFRICASNVHRVEKTNKTMSRQTFATDISREEFEPVRDMLEAARKKTRPRKHDLYDVFCAVLFFLDKGGAWRSLPPDFPPWRTVHEYFTQWTMAPEGVPSLLERVLERAGQSHALEQLRAIQARR
jgi:transposase